MDCNKVRENLSALIDNELCAEEREELMVHIAECEACRKEYESLLDIRAQFKSLDRELRIALSKSATSPADKAMEEIYKEAYPRRRLPFFMRHIGTAAALVTVVALFIFAKGITPAKEAMKGMDSAKEESSVVKTYPYNTLDGVLMDKVVLESANDAFSEPMEAPMETMPEEAPVATPMEPSIEETADETDDAEREDFIYYVSSLNSIIPLESGVVVGREHEDFILLNFTNSASGKDFALVEAPIDEVLDELSENYIEVLYSNRVENSEKTLVCYE